jgi:hypothetical protein
VVSEQCSEEIKVNPLPNVLGHSVEIFGAQPKMEIQPLKSPETRLKS